jgi:hypothetical protein
MSDLNNSNDFGDTSGFYPRRREGLGNFFIGMLTGIAVVVGVILLIIGIGGAGALPFLASATPLSTATIESTLTWTPSITFTPTLETPSITPTPSCPREYVVQTGDILETIAERCGTTVGAIVANNPTLDPNNIQVGQTIIIPPPGVGVTPTSIPADTKPGTIITVRVLAGDNLETIAGKCLSTVADIIKLNKQLEEDPNFLSVGMELKCRYGIATPTPKRVSPTYGFTPTYTVTLKP